MFLKSRRARLLCGDLRSACLGQLAPRARRSLTVRPFWPGVEDNVEPIYENRSARARYLISPSPYQVHIAINGENRITQYRSNVIRTPGADDCCRPGGFPMPLTAFAVDEGPHSMDGLLLHAWEGPQRVEAFISRRVMDTWVDPREPYRGRRSLLRSPIRRARQVQSRGDCPDCRRQVSTRRGLQPPASFRGYSLLRHRGKRGERSIPASSCANRRRPLSNDCRVSSGRLQPVHFAI